MLMGRAKAILDKKGRVAIPAALRKAIEEAYGREIFITSPNPEVILLYPLSEWDQIASLAAKRAKKFPPYRKFLLRANYVGARAEIDKRGRVLIPGWIRSKVAIRGKVVIEGRESHLVLTAFQER